MKIAAAVLAAWTLAPGAPAETEVHVRPVADPTFPELPGAIRLWNGDAPGSEGQTSPLQMRWQNYDTTWYAVVTNVNVPAIIPFLPQPGKATGEAVVVCPGGGHQNLAMEHEGYAVGKWLSEHGVATFVLEYRLARAPGSTYTVELHSLMDAQRAIRTVRSRAKEWGVNPAAVGIMGFSAGGEVAALAATRFDNPVKGSSDAVDSLDCRPDFQALFYPGIARQQPAPTPRTPPAFLCGAYDDQFNLTPPMVRYYLKLAEAGVPTELHVYAKGGHGFGIRDEDKAVYSWMSLFQTWLRGAALSQGPAR
ncbi:MAG TPA: alpha/beta hydrolase [Opitutaceae bacterium]|nr:alpha/beta hydrolase [Opitutaceae bacterium]